MKRYIKYFRYLLVHKWYVFKKCRELKVPIFQSLIHDWTKFLPNEFITYSKFYFDEKGGLRNVTLDKTKLEFKDTKNNFMKAWKHHVHYHKHHWQAWLDENNQPSEMEDIYLNELVGDWVGTGMSLNNGKIVVNKWYAENKDMIILHPKTRLKIENLLKKYKDTI